MSRPMRHRGAGRVDDQGLALGNGLTSSDHILGEAGALSRGRVFSTPTQHDNIANEEEI